MEFTYYRPLPFDCCLADFVMHQQQEPTRCHARRRRSAITRPAMHATVVSLFFQGWSIGSVTLRDLYSVCLCTESSTSIQCLFLESPNLQIPSPQTAAKLCVLNLFFRRDNELQIHHGNFLLMDNKHRKLAYLSLKCTKICLAAWLRPDPLWERMRSRL